MQSRDENGEGWEIKQVLYVDDMVLVAETREQLQDIVNEFERACNRMGLKINVGKRLLPIAFTTATSRSCEFARFFGNEQGLRHLLALSPKLEWYQQRTFFLP